MGRLDVDQMLSEMTPSQMNGWLAYDIVEPWGEEREDIRSAWMTAAIISENGFHDEPVEASRLLPYFGPKPKKKKKVYMSPEDAAAQLKREVGGG